MSLSAGRFWILIWNMSSAKTYISDTLKAHIGRGGIRTHWKAIGAVPNAAS